MVLSPAHLDILLIWFCLFVGTDNWILSIVISNILGWYFLWSQRSNPNMAALCCQMAQPDPACGQRLLGTRPAWTLRNWDILAKSISKYPAHIHFLECMGRDFSKYVQEYVEWLDQALGNSCDFEAHGKGPLT